MGVSAIESATSGAAHRLWERRRGQASLSAGPHAGYVLELGALVVAYYLSAHLGYALKFAGPVAAIVWLPVGVGIAFLYVGGLQLWPAVVIGDLLVNDYSALPIGSAIGQSFGNVLEVVLAAALLRRLRGRGSPLDTLPGAARVIGVLAAATALSATIGVLSLSLGGVLEGFAPRVWRTWWLGDLAGALIVVPLVIALSTGVSLRRLRGRAVEVGLLVVAVAGSSLVALDTSAPVTYIVFPALILAALRFGPRGATAAIVVTSAIAIWATTHYHGPFGFHSIDRAVLDTQLFIAITAIATLTLAAVAADRADLSRRLAASRARLIAATDNERRRLERDLHDGAQQRLVAMLIRLDTVDGLMTRDPDAARQMIGQFRPEVGAALEEIRSLASGIYPGVLTVYGLGEAMRSLGERSPLPASVEIDGDARCRPEVEAAVYFCCSEALQNAARHADRATAVSIRLRRRGDLRFEVRDNGRGFSPTRVRAGHGLSNMRDRVESVGGTLEIHSRRGEGTSVIGTVADPGVPVDNA